MTSTQKLELAAKIAYEAERAFPTYTEWFNSHNEDKSRFTLDYKAYELAKMQAAKRAIAKHFENM